MKAIPYEPLTQLTVFYAGSLKDEFYEDKAGWHLEKLFNSYVERGSVIASFIPPPVGRMNDTTLLK